MKAVFVRHRFRHRQELLEALWKKRLIAVMYRNIESTDPKDYDGVGKQALTRMRSYCESGAIVGADYRLIRPSSMLIGRIRKGSEIRIFPFVDPTTRKRQFYKVIKLKRVKEVSFVDVPLLRAIQPQQGTITRWPSAQDVLESIIHRRPLAMQVSSLDPGQLEVLCFEYLRQRRILRKLVLPIGRNLYDIDIVGITGMNKMIFAQVTHSRNHSKIEDKLRRLNGYARHSVELYFFGPDNHPVTTKGITFISIEKVFERLAARPSTLSFKMIHRMLNANVPNNGAK
jgi:hypothetical protein